MRSRPFIKQSLVSIAALMLVGCDMITGAGDQKNLDAEAIGYACRVSLKVPENCMKENETQSPTSILKGWKAADRDIEEQVIDPNMGVKPAAHSAPVAVENEGNAAAEKGAEKAAVDKDEKATASTRQNKGAAEKKPSQ